MHPRVLSIRIALGNFKAQLASSHLTSYFSPCSAFRPPPCGGLTSACPLCRSFVWRLHMKLRYQTLISRLKHVRACGEDSRHTSMVNTMFLCTLFKHSGNRNTVSFDGSSQGRLAMVIYEWSDNAMLGKTTSTSDDTLPVCVLADFK